MSVYVVRHEISEANNRDNYGTLAFDNPNAPLMPVGRERAVSLGEMLVSEFGIDLAKEPVAVSKMRRSQQTAMLAGFHILHVYPELNEVKGNLTDQEIQDALDERKPPEATKKAARLLLKYPPNEGVWITHGLLIATLCQELDVYQDERFIPKFGEIRKLPI